VDLTRAASIVQSRTSDALFGLVTMMPVYFVTGSIVKLVLRLLSARIGGEAA